MESVTGQGQDELRNNIDPDRICVACGNECHGPSIRDADGGSVCGRCFRMVRYRIILDENREMRIIYGSGKGRLQR